MPRKGEPSFELKKIIWDMAAKGYKDKYSAIQRHLDRVVADQESNEDVPDIRIIKRIINEGINELSPEVVVSELPRHVWELRDDYESIKQLAKGSSQNSVQSKVDLEQKPQPQTYLETQEARIHDKGIFENSDKIMSEYDFGKLFEFLSRNSFLRSHQYKLSKFLKYFKLESNKYADWHLNYVCQELCNNLKELLSYTENDSVERDLVLHFYDEYRKNSVENEYTRFLKKLCADTSDLHSPELDELYLIMDDQSSIWLDLHNQPELSDNFHGEHSWKFQMECSQLVNNARNAHKTYRAAVRETLSL